MAKHKYMLQQEGSIWIAAAPGYFDPSDQPVGRGSTQEEAIENLTQQPEFQLWLRENGLTAPTLAEFEINTRAHIDLTFTDANKKRHRTNPSTD